MSSANPETTGSQGADLTVAVTNANNGKQDQFKADPSTFVSTIIERMYASTKLGIGQPSPADRLQCKGGDDVFQNKSLPLDAYRERHCQSLQWVFSGPTGGA
jgi:hypothetical protein